MLGSASAALPFEDGRTSREREGRNSGKNRQAWAALTPAPRVPHHLGMERRRFLLTSVAGAVAAPLTAWAQAPPRVIALSPGGPVPHDALAKAFVQGMRDHGYLASWSSTSGRRGPSASRSRRRCWPGRIR
jgi:hypothetical protein